MPEDAPLAFVSVEPVPGWTATCSETALDEPVEVEGEEVTEAVSAITWSGGSIGAGQFQRFVGLGRTAARGRRVAEFPAIQTYSDGEEVGLDRGDAGRAARSRSTRRPCSS